jgi:hypothetical protein
MAGAVRVPLFLENPATVHVQKIHTERISRDRQEITYLSLLGHNRLR